MFLRTWRPSSTPTNARQQQRLERTRFRPQLEALEGRIVPAFTLTKVANVASVNAGDNITYTIQLTTDTADTGILINDSLPANTTFVSAAQGADGTTDATQYTPSFPAVGANGKVQWRTTDLPANETDTFTLVVRVNASAVSPVSNTVVYTSGNHPSPAGVRATTPDVAVIAAADLAITKTGPQGPVTEGTAVTYAITVTNNGPSDALDVVVTDMVPAGAILNSITFPQGTRGSGPAANTFDLGTVATGTTITGTVVITPFQDGTITNAATVSSSSPDANSANNSASADTSVLEDSIIASAVAVNGIEFSPLSNVPVATFTHANGLQPVGDFSATINWGDGTSSPGQVTVANGVYSVTGTHIYTDERNFTITVSITEGTASGTSNSTATILEELLPDGSRGTPDQRFISEIYRDMLGRKLDQAGLNTWAGELASGKSRLQVVKHIQNDSHNEFRMDEVEAIYQQYLHRAADPTGLAADVAFLRGGGTVEQIIAQVASSPEYNGRTNGTNDGWLDTFYQDALNRAVDPSGRVAWDGAFAGGASRAQVAAAILMSDEYRHDLVETDYQRYLDRTSIGDAFAQNWFMQLQHGARDEDVIAGIISDPGQEFYGKTLP